MEKIESYFDLNTQIFEIIYPEVNSVDKTYDTKSFKVRFLNEPFKSSFSKNKLELDSLKNQVNVIDHKISIKKSDQLNKNEILNYEEIHFLEFERGRITFQINFLENNKINVERELNKYERELSNYEKSSFPIIFIHYLKNLFGDEIGEKLITSGIIISELDNKKRNSRIYSMSDVNCLDRVFNFFNLKKILNYKFDIFSPISVVDKIEIKSLPPENKSNIVSFINKSNLSILESKEIALNDFDAIFLFDFLNRWSSDGIGSTGKLIKRRGGEGIDTSVKDELESDFNTLINLVNNSNYEGKIFILTDFYSSKRVIKYIKKYGFDRHNISAIFTLGNYIGEDFRGSDLELIIIDNKNQSKIFVASIAYKMENLSLILENYKNLRNSNNNLHNGVLCDLKDYFSFNQLKKIGDYNDFGNTISDFTTFSLSEVTTKFIEYKSVDKEFDKSPNSLFFSYSTFLKNFKVFGEKVVGPVTSGHQYIVQLVLDETKVLSSYLNRYFLDPELGGRLVGSNESRDSSSIVFQSSRDILDINIFIPPSIEIQKERVSLIEKGQKVFNITNKLTDTNVSLTDELESIIELKPQENTLEDWINLCPFPIATILWKYNATISNTEKREYLGFFFEGLSEMLVMLILSSFVQDEEYFKKYRGRWFNEKKFFNWYETTSFGTWCTLYSKLSDFISKELVRDEVFIRNILGNPSDEFLNMLKSDEIKNVLWESNELRKNTKGHNFAISKEKEKELLSLWEEYLHKILPIIGIGFSNTFIVKPTISSLSKNKFNFVVKLLLGHNLELKEGKIETDIIMDSDELYLYHKNQLKPIHVIPYIRYIESKNACYFYSKMVGKTYRFVSYHHGIDGELNEDNFESDLLERFVQLLPKDPNS